MAPEKSFGSRWGFWLALPLAALLPALLALQIGAMSRTPSLGFTWSDHGVDLVWDVALGGPAHRAGIRPGAVLVSLDGEDPDDLILVQGEVVAVSTLVPQGPDGGQVDLEVTSLLQAMPWRLAGMVLIFLIPWLCGGLVLLRTQESPETRIFFVLCQVLGAALLTGLWLDGGWPHPRWVFIVFVLALHLAPACFFHYRLADLARPGGRPVWWLAGAYSLVLGGAAAFLLDWISPWVSLGSAGFLALAGVGVGVAAYFRRATPRQRQRMRLRTLGLVMAGGAVLVRLAVMAARTPLWPLFPAWFSTLMIALAPLSDVFSRRRRGLYWVDRLLYHLMVGLVLLLGLGGLFLGGFWLGDAYLPDGFWIRGAALTLLALGTGFLFSPTRRVIRRGMTWLFYGQVGGSPRLLEAAGQALAGCLSRRELNQVLTRDIPDILRLSGAELWFGEAAFAPTRKAEVPLLSFELEFQAKVRAIWTLFPYQDGRPFSAQDRRILSAVARQAEAALRNVLLVEALRRRLDEIRAGQELLAEAQHQLLRSRDNERSRLARDLHDGPIQDLVALNLSLGLLETDSGEMDSELAELRAAVRALISELRQVCAVLRPPLLDTLGLGAALQSLVADWAEETGMAAEMRLEAPSESLTGLSDEAMVNLYRILQEALHNIGKHARARHVSVRLQCDDALLTLTIRDDGAGFALPDTFRGLTQEGHFGLVGMRERVNLIGGKWALDSSPGKGTTVEVTLPLS